MSINFPILSQTKVILELGSKKYLVSMLPVVEVDKLDYFPKMAVDGYTNQKTELLTKCKQEMIDLAYTVVPKEIPLIRLKLEQLIELLAYLMYGEEKEEDLKELEKKPQTKKKIKD